MYNDSSMRFYTGFPNWSTVLAVFNYLNPGDERENVAYWLSQSNVSFPAEFYAESKVEPSRKLGRPRNLRPIDEYFAVMCRLRQGLPEEHLAHLFKDSVSTASRVFIAWVNFMYLRLGQINICQRILRKNIRRPELLLTAQKLGARCQVVCN